MKNRKGMVLAARGMKVEGWSMMMMEEVEDTAEAWVYRNVDEVGKVGCVV